MRKGAIGRLPVFLAVLALAWAAPLAGVTPPARADVLGFDQVLESTKYGPLVKMLNFIKKAYGEGKDLTAECDCWRKFVISLLIAKRENDAAEIAVVLDECFALGNIQENAPALVAQDMLKALNADPGDSFEAAAGELLAKLNELCFKPAQAAGEPSPPPLPPPPGQSRPPGIDEAACPKCAAIAAALRDKRAERERVWNRMDIIDAKLAKLAEPRGLALRTLEMLSIQYSQLLANHPASRDLPKKWSAKAQAEIKLKELDSEIDRLEKSRARLREEVDRISQSVRALRQQLDDCNRTCQEIDKAGPSPGSSPETSFTPQLQKPDFKGAIGTRLTIQKGRRKASEGRGSEVIDESEGTVREKARQAMDRAVGAARATAQKPAAPKPGMETLSPGAAPDAATGAAPAMDKGSPAPPPRPEVEMICREIDTAGKLIYEGPCPGP